MTRTTLTQKMRNRLCLVTFAFLAVSLGSACSPSQDQYNVTVASLQIPPEAKDGLDLRAVGELVGSAKDAEDLERQLNDASLGLNNLDLDSDGTVDYLSVEEFGAADSRGFMLIAKLQDGQSQEVATIDIEKKSESEADLEVRGNERIYGANHYHHSRFGIGDYLMMRWMFGGHSLYRSPYSYGRYPGYYSRYSVSPRSDYRNRTARATQSSRLSSSTSSRLSPKHSSRVQSQKASLRSATTSQRSFQSRSGGSSRSGGFGRRTQPSARSARSSGSYRGGK